MSTSKPLSKIDSRNDFAFLFDMVKQVIPVDSRAVELRKWVEEPIGEYLSEWSSITALVPGVPVQS